jgi:hypothetical protein
MPWESADEMMPGLFGTRLVNPSATSTRTHCRRSRSATGGAYFRARDAEALARICDQLDELEPVESDREAIRPVDELFHWPLALALALALAAALLLLRPAATARRRTAVASNGFDAPIHSPAVAVPAAAGRAGAVWWQRGRRPAGDWARVCDPHLLRWLSVEQGGERARAAAGPGHGWRGLALLITIVALADQLAEAAGHRLVGARRPRDRLDLSRSMLAEDLRPTG